MAGLYVHIPFCKRRCLYCDFFSTTQLTQRKEYIDAVLQEIAQRKDEASEPIRTIYIGGGTPSTLEASDIMRLLQAIGTKDATEITMEMNPGDASPKYLRELRLTGINRLSIGIQSFQDELLVGIGRRHNAAQAIEAVRMAQEAGFANLSIDLMYALPGQTMTMWQADIETALRLNVQHISSYGLMYEEGTALTQMRDSTQIEPVDEDTENAMYDYLCERLKQAGFVHYEVSNFALPRYEAQHNSNYWNGTPYIGIGAGAHSYIGRGRSWNPDDLDVYIRGIMAHDLMREKEILSARDLYNEKIMLGLRTSKGIKENDLYEYAFNTDGQPTVNRQSRLLSDYEKNGMICRTADGRIVATQQGLHILNRIIEELMIDE